jgi:hypothetical protein
VGSQETESLTERELAEELFEDVFSGRPRSVGEALAAADEIPPEPAADEIPEPPVEEPPLVVTDEPTQPDTPEGQPGEEVAPEPELELEGEAEDLDTEDDENVVWAKKKYGDEPHQWAKAARNQERHISQLANELREAQEVAVQQHGYIQQLEQQAQSASFNGGMGMPLSSQEEAWVEQAMSNPYGYAQQAAFQGNGQLFNAVLTRVAEENPMLAGQISAQVQQDLQQAAYQQQGPPQEEVHPQAQLPIALAQSFVRLGIDLAESGPPMAEKIGELGEYHPYVQAILTGDERQRDLAVQAVYDLMRSSKLTKRVVRDEQSAERIRREGELRREAAGVVQGSPHTPSPQQDPFMQAMEDEWKQRGQWGGE